ncbi:MAG: gliding motility-associated C-terminal domain-containing protein [Bacteroidetes bacterium]|nr:gliding motility-associated C-terminal domain-containing protein [Bacteroidota bacterium]
MNPFFYNKPKQSKQVNRFMLTVTVVTAILMLSVITVRANNNGTGNNDPALSAKAKEWLEKKNENNFLENQGQMMDMKGIPVPFVLFKAGAPGLNLWITETGTIMQTLHLRREPIPENELTERDKEKTKKTGKPKTKKYFDWERIDVELKGANIQKENIIKEGASTTDFNFFYGHCPDGIYGAKEYEKITIKEVYPGIDWVWYSHPQKGYKYDFVVHPGADYQQIKLLYKSKTPIQINPQGELELYTQYGNIKENTPISFYEGKEIETKFKYNEQNPITINGDNGYETSISFHFPQTLNLESRTSNLIIDPQLIWGTFFGGTSYEGPMAIDTDANDNVFVTGYLGSSDFPVLDAGTYFQGAYAGGNDVFILKFNNVGVPIWATYYGGNGTDHGYGIATDASGNVFVTGYTNMSPTFPVQNAGTYFQGASGGFEDIFILKFDNAGNRLWATFYGGNGDESFDGSSIATDASGNVFVTGNTSSTTFPVQNGGTFFQGANAGATDAFILKFDNLGNRLWATYYGGSGFDFGFAITTDNSGNLFVTGATGSGDLPVQNAGTYFQGPSGGDAFILKFDNLGNRLWATYYGGSLADGGYSIATDNSGNLFVAGLTSSIDLPVQNAGTFYQGTNGGGDDAFILKFDNVGNRLWATYYGGSGVETFGSSDNLAIDSCNNVYLSFGTTSTNVLTQAPCDGGYFDPTYNGGAHDILLSLFTNTGIRLWETYLGGDGDDFRSPLAVDNSGNLFVSGEWTFVTSSASCPVTNPGGGAYYDGTFNGGDDDAFMIKFLTNSCICSSSTSTGCSTGTDVITSCISITWIDGNTYSASTNTPTFTIVGGAANGCDSIVILNLTITAAVTGTDIISSCDSLTWIDGNTYLASTNTPTFIIVGGAANGCDSIVTLNLTINSFVSSIDVQTACNSFTWIDGNNYTASTNTPTFAIVGGATNGCDSIITLNLTINSFASGTDVITSCTPITWIDGNTYSANTTTPKDTIIGGSFQGCDSIVTLNLTISLAATSTDIITSCSPITWLDGNTYSASTTTPTFTIVGGAANGCDSVVTLNLTITAAVTGTDIISSCTPITWIDGNTYSANINTPTFTIVGGAANGCDSVVTLNLTITAAVTGTDVITSCTPITWMDGNTYSASTSTPTFTIIGGAANGCDSIVTLNLTITSAVTGTDIITSCTPIVWIDGNTYSASTSTPTFTIIGGAANGCDSIVTLNLTITSAVTGTDIITSCTPIVWIDGNTYTASTSTPTFTIVGGAANGCDSIVTLNLTIITPNTTTNVYNECEGFSVTIGTNTYTTTGVFTDIINNCDTVITNLTINSGPQLTLVKVDDNCEESIGSIVANVVSSNPPVTYIWNTGSTNSTISNLPVGVYSVIVNDGSGCAKADTINIDDLKIDCDYFVYLPNAFTPNGDGNNDIFFVRGKGIEALSVKIYNRWGNKVFEINDVTQGWDGTYKGSEQNTAVFVYVLEVTFQNGKIITESGDVELIR